MSIAPQEFDAGARAYLEGDMAAAERCFKRVLKKDPQHADALHLLGLIALQANRREAAERFLHQAIAADPSNQVYHGSLATALREHGDLAGAVSCYRRALKLKPDYAPALHNLGLSLLDRDEADEAEDSFRRLLEISPADATAHFGLANALYARTRYDDAIASFRTAIRHRPDYGEAHANLGDALFKTGRIEDATGHSAWPMSSSLTMPGF